MSDIAVQARYEQFVELHLGPDTFILPNAWDGPSALPFKEAGFGSLFRRQPLQTVFLTTGFIVLASAVLAAAAARFVTLAQTV